jgi:selenocysteine lyase/cysteine desulfurase
MKAGLELLVSHGIETIADRLLELKARLVAGLDDLGFQILGHRSGPLAHSTTTFRHPQADPGSLFKLLETANIVCSLRHDAMGIPFLRFSPHFYNTEAEIDRALNVLRAGM